MKPRKKALPAQTTSVPMGLVFIKSATVSWRGYLIIRWFVAIFNGELWVGGSVLMSTLHIQSPATALSPAFSVIQLEAIRPTVWEWVIRAHWNNTILPRSTKYFIYMKGVGCQEMLCGRWQDAQASHLPFLRPWGEEKSRYPASGLQPVPADGWLSLKWLVPILSPACAGVIEHAELPSHSHQKPLSSRHAWSESQRCPACSCCELPPFKHLLLLFGFFVFLLFLIFLFLLLLFFILFFCETGPYYVALADLELM